MKYVFFLRAFFFLLCGLLYAEDSHSEFDHLYVEVCEFEGDEDLDFVGDPVAILDDTSRWKIHPRYVDQFAEWQLGETVHIARRTDWYWFKREHKFLLVNHDRNASIPVMLVYRGDAPLTIAAFEHSDVAATRSTLTLSDGSFWHIENSASGVFSEEAPLYMGYNQEADRACFFVIGGIEKNVETWSVERGEEIDVIKK